MSPLCDKEKEQNQLAVTQGKLNVQAALALTQFAQQEG